MKKVVFLVNSDNVFLQNYIEELHKAEKMKITVISFVKTKRMPFYNKYGVKFIYMPQKQQISNVSSVFYWLRAFMYIKQNKGQIDIAHVHLINCEEALKYAQILKRKNGKLILTYWGGDVYAKSHETYMRERKYLEEAHKINVMADDMKEILNREYDFAFDKKCEVVSFGNSTLRYTDRYLSKYGEAGLKRIACKKFSFPMDKLVIAIGYSGRPQQQHIRVIKQIAKYDNEVKNKIFLYCHMAYDTNTENYMERVKRELKKTGCQYTVNEEYLNASQIAIMKMGVDIFVHAGKYDALSDSMLEYLYAGKKVFNPEWIEYGIFETKGIRDIKYADFEDLGNKLLLAIKDPYWPTEIKVNNRTKVGEISGWDDLLPQWLELYQ